ncbi:hypothetical protein J6590_075254, partial [Homalodisca vitripennis]
FTARDNGTVFLHTTAHEDHGERALPVVTECGVATAIVRLRTRNIPGSYHLGPI